MTKKNEYHKYKWIDFPSNWIFLLLNLFIFSVIFFFFKELKEGTNLANLKLEAFYSSKNSPTPLSFPDELDFVLDSSSKNIENDNFTFKDGKFYSIVERRGRKFERLIQNQELNFEVKLDDKITSKVLLNENQEISILYKFYNLNDSRNFSFRSLFIKRDENIDDYENLGLLVTQSSDGKFFVESFFANGLPYQFLIFNSRSSMDKNQPVFSLIFDNKGKLLKHNDFSYVYEGYLNLWKLKPKRINSENRIKFELSTSKKLFSKDLKYNIKKLSFF